LANRLRQPAVLGELLVGGLAAITGAFVAGIGFGRSRLREEIEQNMHTSPTHSWFDFS
jgi:Kef-type K+ transport system membrane component KefB